MPACHTHLHLVLQALLWLGEGLIEGSRTEWDNLVRQVQSHRVLLSPVPWPSHHRLLAFKGNNYRTPGEQDSTTSDKMANCGDSDMDFREGWMRQLGCFGGTGFRPCLSSARPSVRFSTVTTPFIPCDNLMWWALPFHTSQRRTVRLRV